MVVLHRLHRDRQRKQVCGRHEQDRLDETRLGRILRVTRQPAGERRPLLAAVAAGEIGRREDRDECGSGAQRLAQHLRPFGARLDALGVQESRLLVVWDAEALPQYAAQVLVEPHYLVARGAIISRVADEEARSGGHRGSVDPMPLSLC